MGELVELNRAAELDAVESRRLMTTGAGADPTDGVAIAYALLAIERRLAMLAVFTIAAMEEDKPERKPRI